MPLMIEAMPSYDDVLVIIKQGNAESAEVAAYFQAQRQIPANNVITLNPGNAIPSVAQREAFVQAIKNHMTANNLQSKINYIVLSSGFPFECMDVEDSTLWGTPNSSGTQWEGRSVFDAYLMWALSDTYPSTTGTNCIPIGYNPYYFVRSNNYENRKDIKFSRNKHSYYIVSRLDGGGSAIIKKLIDNSGYAAYDQYTDGINFLLYCPMNIQDSYNYHAERAELLRRGVNIIDSSYAVNGSSHNYKNINFAYFDWVSDCGADAVISYRNIHKHIYFDPGAIVFCHRSFPAGTFKRPASGLSRYTLNTKSTVNFMKTDASDMLLRHMVDSAVVPDSGNIWCALGQNLLKLYGSSNPASANNYRGNGIAVYAQDGSLAAHYTAENSGLPSDAVYRVVHDPYNNKIWIATFKGVAAYNLSSGAWERPAGLYSAAGNPAPVHSIYVDPTTSGRYLYVTFSRGNAGYTPDITDYLSVIEYNTVLNTTRRLKFHGDNDMYNASVVKTASNIIWAVYYRNIPRKAVVSKYKIDTGELLTNIDLAGLNGNDYNTLSWAANYVFSYPIAAGSQGPTNHIYVGIRNVTANFNGILRLTDTETALTMDIWGHTATYAANLSYYTHPTRLIVPQAAPETVYVLFQDRYDTSAGSRVYRFSDEEIVGTVMMNSSSVLSGAISSIVFGSDTNTLYYTQHLYGASHEPVVDFFPFGAIAGSGGFSHRQHSYGGIKYFFSFNSDLVSASDSPDSFRDRDIYERNSVVTYNQPFNTSIHLMNGFYLAEARFAVLGNIPYTGSGGWNGHMFIFDPKASPYAPRVDFSRITAVVPDARFSVTVFSPGVAPTERGIFLSETVNTQTVRLYDGDGNIIPADSINVINSSTHAVITLDARTRRANGDYRLVLSCGINGIKNLYGAALLNTRPDEFSDEISIPFTVNGALPLYSISGTVSGSMPEGTKLTLINNTSGSIQTTNTGAAGAFIFRATEGSYRIIPQKNDSSYNFSFTPAHLDINLTTDTTDNSFAISSSELFTLSGTFSNIPDDLWYKVHISNTSGTVTKTIDAHGTQPFNSRVPNGEYSVSYSGLNFPVFPSARTVRIENNDSETNDFIAQVNISGNLATNAIIVTIRDTVTGEEYTSSGSTSFSFNVRPSRRWMIYAGFVTGQVISPATINTYNLNSNAVFHFTNMVPVAVTAYSRIHGEINSTTLVTLSNKTTGGSASVLVTNTSYEKVVPSIKVLHEGEYVIEPYSAGYIFFPSRIERYFPASSNNQHKTISTIYFTNNRIAPHAYWKMDTISGGQTISTNGTLPGNIRGGAMLSAGVLGNALSCNGINGRAEVTVSTNPEIHDYRLGNLTISAWIRADLAETNGGAIFTLSGADTNLYTLSLTADKKLSFHLLAKNEVTLNSYALTSPASLSAGVWYHVSSVISFETITLYINGVPVATGNHTLVCDTVADVAPYTVVLGSRRPQDSGWTGNEAESFSGLIDDTLLYYRSLNDSEVLALYNSAPITKYTLSGTISGPAQDGSSLCVSNTGTGGVFTVLPGIDGTFSLQTADGYYRVSPSKTGYTFSPAYTNITVSGSGVTGINFSSVVYVAPPVVTVPASYITNQACTLPLAVDKNYGYWSTNGGLLFNQFTSAGTNINISETVTLQYFGKDTADNTSATNSTTYTIIIAAVPNAPDNLHAVWSNDMLKLSWTDNSDNETGFRIYHSTDKVIYQTAGSAGANVASWIGTNFTPRTTYYFKICAFNDTGESALTGAVSYRIPAQIRVTDFKAVPDPILNTIAFSYILNKNCAESVTLRVWYSESGKNEWYDVPGHRLQIQDPVALNGTFKNVWELGSASLLPKKLDMKIVAVLDHWDESAAVIAPNIDLSGLFVLCADLSRAAVLNSPWRGVGPVVFVNLPEIVHIRIFTVSGKLMNEINSETQEKNSGRCIWNVTDIHGKKVLPGIYLCDIISGNERKVLRVMVTQ